MSFLETQTAFCQIRSFFMKSSYNQEKALGWVLNVYIISYRIENNWICIRICTNIFSYLSCLISMSSLRFFMCLEAFMMRFVLNN